MYDFDRDELNDNEANPEEKAANTRRGASETEFTQISASVQQSRQYTAQGYAVEYAGEQTAPNAMNNASNWEAGGQAMRAQAANQNQRQAPIMPPPTLFYTTPTQVRPSRSPRPAQQSRGNMGVAILAMGLFVTTLAFGLGLFVVLRVANAGQDVGGDPAIVAAEATATDENTVAGIAETPAPTATVGVDIQPWDGKRRFTILLMGIDKRPNDKGTAFRTDSMMVFSIDPKTKTVGLLSIPRDLFIDIPRDTVVRNSYGLQRVNAAYVIGELARPGYGPQLAMQTVQYNLGMRINDYIVFDFNTVINAVDAVGGIDIDVPRAIYDATYPDMYYGYDPLRIPAGKVHMDGTLALKYGRSRHSTSDFDRAKRQQQVIIAMRDKVLNLNMAPGLIAKAPQLWQQFSTTTKSSLRFEHLLQLAVYLKDVPKENIHQGVLDIQYVSPVNWNGASVLVPERAKIGPLLREIFGASYAD
jgi:LCP family protein required for cell wall assembly